MRSLDWASAVVVIQSTVIAAVAAATYLIYRNWGSPVAGFRSAGLTFRAFNGGIGNLLALINCRQPEYL